MKFSIATATCLAVAAISQSVGAASIAPRQNGITMTVPSTLKPGQSFQVTYHHSGSSSNVEWYEAVYGLTSSISDFENSSTAIGSEPFTNNNLSDFEFAGAGVHYGSNVTITLPDMDYFEIYKNNGNYPNPWLISSANMIQTGASGGVALNVVHAQTTIDFS